MHKVFKHTRVDAKFENDTVSELGQRSTQCKNAYIHIKLHILDINYPICNPSHPYT